MCQEVEGAGNGEADEWARPPSGLPPASLPSPAGAWPLQWRNAFLAAGSDRETT